MFHQCIYKSYGSILVLNVPDVYQFQSIENQDITGITCSHLLLSCIWTKIKYLDEIQDKISDRQSTDRRI